jgi:hypothetical protein
MPDHEVGALIERIVAGARIPGRAARDDLRRELWTHFEEAGSSPDALRRALDCFGAEPLVTNSLRRIYRVDTAIVELTRIVASLVASIVAAVLIQLCASLRLPSLAGVWLSPGFSRAAALSMSVVLGLVMVGEVTRRPFDRARAALAVAVYAAVWTVACVGLGVEWNACLMSTLLAAVAAAGAHLQSVPRRLLLLLGTFAAALYLDHLLIGVRFPPVRALVAGGLLMTVCIATLDIVRRVDDTVATWLSLGRSGIS